MNSSSSSSRRNPRNEASSRTTEIPSSSVAIDIRSNATNGSPENNQPVADPPAAPAAPHPPAAFSLITFIKEYIELALHYLDINFLIVRPINQNARGNRAPNAEIGLANTILHLTTQVTIPFVIFYYQSLSSSSSSSSSSSDIGAPVVHFHIIGIALVVAFAGSYIATLLRDLHKKAAVIAELVASASFALAFFVIMGPFLHGGFQWIVWLSGIGCFIFFVFVLLRELRSNDLAEV